MHLFEFLLTTSNISGAVLSLLFALALLLLPVRHAAANRPLALFMFVLGVKFSYDALQQLGLVAPLVVFLQMPLLFLYGPLLYIYLERLTRPGHIRPLFAETWHLLPFVMMLVLYSPALMLTRQELVEIIRGESAGGLTGTQAWLHYLSMSIRMPAFALQFGFCLLLGLRLLHRHRQRVAEEFSYTEKVSLLWVSRLWYLTACIWLLVPARLVVAPALAGWVGLALVPAQAVLVFLLGVFALTQKTIYPDAVEKADDGASPVREKYRDSTLTEAQLADCRRRLEDLMRTGKPYLDSELSVAGLAEAMDISPRHLSQVVNGSYGKTFLDYVNSHRVEEARRLLSAPDGSMSVLAIAMEVGFNSKSAFYTAFRRHAGMTPTAYRQHACSLATGAAKLNPG